MDGERLKRWMDGGKLREMGKNGKMDGHHKGMASIGNENTDRRRLKGKLKDI